MNVAEQLFWAEIGSDKSTIRSVGVCYAVLIAYAAGRLKAEDPVNAEFWRPINMAINERFGWSLPRDVDKIDRIRRIAWSINDAACRLIPSHSQPQA
jgi:hypothetical protein